MKARIQSAVVAMTARGLPHVMVSNLAQQGVAFLTVLIIARLLQPSEFALVRIAMAYAAVATIIAAGGFTAPVLRYCADNAFNAVARRVLLGIGIRKLLIASVMTVVIAAVLVLARQGSTLETIVFGVYALQLPGLAMASLLLVYLQAVQQFKVLATYQVAIRVMALAITAAGTYWYGLAGLLATSLMVAYLACVVLFALSRPIFASSGEVTLPPDFSRLARYSVFGMLVTAVGQYSDLMILDLVGTDKREVAVYSLATIFFFAATALVGAIQGIATPAFTALIDNPVQFNTQLRRWSLMMSLAGIPVATLTVILAFVVEKWFLGSQYDGLGYVLMLLMIKFCLWCTYAVGGAALVGIGAIRQGTWIAIATTTVAIAAGYPLCSQFGIWGAAWTQVVVAAISVGLVWWVISIESRALLARGRKPALAET